jgi:hypothetical protein
MTKPAIPTVLLTALSIVAAASLLSAAESEKGFVAMFNGKDLDGWEGKSGGWTIEDGAITGQSTKEKPCKKHHYLMWRGGKPADFVLRLKYKIVGGNSGVQIRSREIPNWDTRGYQADMEAGDKWTGCLFEHARGGMAMRGTKVVIDKDGKKNITRFAESADLQEKVKADDWNDYEVTAEGNHIVLKINGQLMAELYDNQLSKAASDGVIALQMHPGPPMKVQFKNLRIRLIKKDAEK